MELTAFAVSVHEQNGTQNSAGVPGAMDSRILATARGGIQPDASLAQRRTNYVEGHARQIGVRKAGDHDVRGSDALVKGWRLRFQDPQAPRCALGPGVFQLSPTRS